MHIIHIYGGHTLTKKNYGHYIQYQPYRARHAHERTLTSIMQTPLCQCDTAIGLRNQITAHCKPLKPHCVGPHSMCRNINNTFTYEGYPKTSGIGQVDISNITNLIFQISTFNFHRPKKIRRGTLRRRSHIV